PPIYPKRNSLSRSHSPQYLSLSTALQKYGRLAQPIRFAYSNYTAVCPGETFIHALLTST
ncbi:MAG: hypothetical protein AAGH79_16560, partial [Bacteroidota bacterium]